jgi:nitrate/nitrite-specific signal transduction histidine kinase
MLVTLNRLKWLSVLAPLLFIFALEMLRRVLLPDLFHGWPGTFLYGIIVLAGTLIFAETIFGVVDRLQARIVGQNRELLSLHEASLAVAGELDLQSVLQEVVDQACEIVDARYGALSFLGEDGRIAAFITSGITTAEREAIGPIPEGHGLLGVVLEAGERLRLDDLTQDPRSIGFPAHHPEMHTLLAVPIRSRDRILGNLYVAEKHNAAFFTAADEETLVRLATLATIAIENARLHEQVQILAIEGERQRIAREMHDSLAQILGYVNVKAQAATMFLQNDQQEKATDQLNQLAAAARDSYADVREGILNLRTTIDPDRDFLDVLGDYLNVWRTQNGIDLDFRIANTPSDPGISEMAEIQLLRIVQEALTNIRKHAAASRVLIRFALETDALAVRIEDNGKGFDPDELGPSRLPRFGLSTMRERAEAIGAAFRIETRPDHGTAILIRVPVEHLRRNESHARAHR